MTKAATASRSKISSRPGRVLLISGEDGHACSEAARQLVAGAHGPLDAVRFGGEVIGEPDRAAHQG